MCLHMYVCITYVYKFLIKVVKFIFSAIQEKVDVGETGA